MFAQEYTVPVYLATWSIFLVGWKAPCTYSLLYYKYKSPEFVFELEEEPEKDGELGVFVKGKGQTMTYWLNGYRE